MAEPLSSLIRPHRGPVFPALERLAPPPPENVVAAEIEARSAPGDIVVELHGRGAWVARSAINRLRRVFDLESSALTRLVSEVVLRPPDLRHFDAALNAMAMQPSGNVGLRAAINEWFTSRCAQCGRPVVVEEFIWEGDAPAPSRKSYRCTACKSGDAGRLVPVDAEDLELAADVDTRRAWEALLARFPPRLADEDDLPDQVLELYTPRTLNAIAAITDRIERDLRPDSIAAALRLAVVHMALPASRLNSYPGRVAALRITGGRVRRTQDRQWRERNPWLVFEEGCRTVRAFVQRLESQTTGQTQARLGRDVATLLDGSANVVIQQGSSLAPDDLAGAATGADSGDGPARPRVRLVLAQLPTHWSAENLSFAYVATSLALGRDAASTLPLEALYLPTPRGEWAWDSAVLRRSLAAVRPALGPDARVVLMLDRAGAGGLVAGVLGGVAAGYRLSGAVLAEAGDEIAGTLEFLPPSAELPADIGPLPTPRRLDADGTNRPVTSAVPAASAAASQPGAADADPNGAFQLATVEQAVTDLAVGVLQARGEPARFERLLGEVLIGLDRLGHLRRLVGTQTFSETEDRAEAAAERAGVLDEVVPTKLEQRTPDAPPTSGPESDTSPYDASVPPSRSGNATGRAPTNGSSPAGPSWRDPSRPVRAPLAELQAGAAQPGDPGATPPGSDARTALAAEDPGPFVEPGSEATAPEPPDPALAPRPPARDILSEAIPTWTGIASGSDPVSLLLEIVMEELRRPDHPRLRELEPGRWWLREPADAAAARTPLSDRLEWAVFSLLSTSGGLTESAFFDRIATMFRGHDTPDEELVRACLDSYRAAEPGADGLLRTDDSLQGRTEEHGTIVGMLAEFGHRLGLRCWIAPREQRRLYRGAPLRELLSELEQRVYLPLVSQGASEALEAVDCIWYLRGKATFLFEMEWTAMLDEPVLRRGPRIASTDNLVRFLVVPPERTELVRLKIARSPLLRERMEEDNWHILKSDHVRSLWARDDASLESLEPMLGLDPEIEQQGEQLALFG
ncbi:MAG: hypothetical protein QOH61_112 [Chloroflexota bacterium]|jgi:hypothetical protein|nr:hypothetical protein [Chloroflexota bacterium]